ncbi:DUF881 domain-containing protein [Thalassobacillus hwangdonensis]|uniref:DUF881 domain-containing protein n=1 Tax=Thalassobacillus hwangdonensis TaxID=546108 RepID=A0ABW3KX12_9BACI
MNTQSKWMISIVFGIAGFMVAIQFQTTTSIPETRDTRDKWEIREELQSQQKNQRELLEKIAEADRVLQDYEVKAEKEQVETLKKSIDKLEDKAGLTEMTGNGITITIEPIFQDFGEAPQTYPEVTPELLSRLINELNTYGAKGIAIGNERVTNLTPIRNVNGATYVNNRPLNDLPLEITVIANNPKKMLDYVQVSEARDMFAIDSLGMNAEIAREIVLPKYEDSLNLEILEAKNAEERDEI